VLNTTLIKREDELKREKDFANEADAQRKILDQQLREAQARIEETEEFAKREAKRINAKLEGRVCV
jgi:hypothetical protein